MQSLRKRRAEIEGEERELLGVWCRPPPEPPSKPDDGEEQPRKSFGSDVAYRHAVVEYERKAGRYAEAKDARQPGYDIDSFDKPLDEPSKRLVRRIEVKGHGCDWTDDETFEVSDRQFLDAVAQKTDELALADDFDYWLYVVERHDDCTLHAIPIRSRRCVRLSSSSVRAHGAILQSTGQRTDYFHRRRLLRAAGDQEEFMGRG